MALVMPETVTRLATCTDPLWLDEHYPRHKPHALKEILWEELTYAIFQPTFRVDVPIVGWNWLPFGNASSLFVCRHCKRILNAHVAALIRCREPRRAAVFEAASVGRIRSSLCVLGSSSSRLASGDACDVDWNGQTAKSAYAHERCEFACIFRENKLLV